MEQDHLFFTLLEADDSRDHTGDKAVFKERFHQLALEVDKLNAEMTQEADEQKEPDALVAAVQEQQQIAMMGKQGQADEELGDDEQGECYDEKHGYDDEQGECYDEEQGQAECYDDEQGECYEEEEECMPDEEEEDYMPDDEDEEEECMPDEEEECIPEDEEQEFMPDDEQLTPDEEVEQEECMPDEEEECIPGDKEEVFTPVDEQLMPDEEAEEEECMPDGEDEEEEDCIDIFNDSENQ